MDAFSRGFWGTFLKVASVDEEELQQSIDRLQKLESSPPDVRQLRRYAGIGAVVTPIASGIEKLVAGDPILHREGGRVQWGGSLRKQLGKSVAGAIGGGLMPILRHRVDQGLERTHLQEQLAKMEAPAMVPAGTTEKLSSALIPGGSTPGARLASARKKGEARMTGLSGPSISQLSKPQGFGSAGPGTTKSTL